MAGYYDEYYDQEPDPYLLPGEYGPPQAIEGPEQAIEGPPLAVEGPQEAPRLLWNQNPGFGDDPVSDSPVTYPPGSELAARGRMTTSTPAGFQNEDAPGRPARASRGRQPSGSYYQPRVQYPPGYADQQKAYDQSQRFPQGDVQGDVAVQWVKPGMALVYPAADVNAQRAAQREAFSKLDDEGRLKYLAQAGDPNAMRALTELTAYRAKFTIADQRELDGLNGKIAALKKDTSLDEGLRKTILFPLELKAAELQGKLERTKAQTKQQEMEEAFNAQGTSAMHSIGGQLAAIDQATAPKIAAAKAGDFSSIRAYDRETGLVWHPNDKGVMVPTPEKVEKKPTPPKPFDEGKARRDAERVVTDAAGKDEDGNVIGKGKPAFDEKVTARVLDAKAEHGLSHELPEPATPETLRKAQAELQQYREHFGPKPEKDGVKPKSTPMGPAVQPRIDQLFGYIRAHTDETGQFRTAPPAQPAPAAAPQGDMGPAAPQVPPPAAPQPAAPPPQPKVIQARPPAIPPEKQTAIFENLIKPMPAEVQSKARELDAEIRELVSKPKLSLIEAQRLQEAKAKIAQLMNWKPAESTGIQGFITGN